MSATWNQEKFNRTLAEYQQFSKRTLPQILNTKGFFIARRATVLTPRTPASVIKTSLGTIVKRRKAGPQLKLIKADRRDMSLAEAIIRARLHREGKDQPTSSEIASLIEKMILARRKSRAYLASGWLPAIKMLEQAVDPKYRRGAPRQDKTSSQVGVPKGNAKPATSFSWTMRTTIENAIGASGKRSAEQNKALNKYAGPPLDQAVADETRSMVEYMERQMKPDADRFNRQQH